MTLAFDALLARADAEALAASVGPAGARLLAALDGGALTPLALREVALGLHGPTGLLDDAVHRARRPSLLRPDEARALRHGLGQLAGAAEADPYPPLGCGPGAGRRPRGGMGVPSRTQGAGWQPRALGMRDDGAL